MGIELLWIIGIPLSFIIETAVGLWVNKEYLMEKAVADDKMKKAIELTSTRCLTLIVASTAAIAFLLGQIEIKTDLTGSILVLGLSFALFFISLKFEPFAPNRRIFSKSQKRLFDYGLITLISGLGLAYGVYVPTITIVLVFLLIILMSWHIIEEAIDDNYATEWRRKRRRVEYGK